MSGTRGCRADAPPLLIGNPDRTFVSRGLAGQAAQGLPSEMSASSAMCRHIKDLGTAGLPRWLPVDLKGQRSVQISDGYGFSRRRQQFGPADECASAFYGHLCAQIDDRVDAPQIDPDMRELRPGLQPDEQGELQTVELAAARLTSLLSRVLCTGGIGCAGCILRVPALWYGLLMIVQIITGLSGAAVVVSLLFLARQTRELTRQTRLSNRIGTLAGMHDTLEILHAIQSVFTEKPELRSYFYEGRQCPRKGNRRAVVLNLAELMADAVDYGLMVLELMPGTPEYEGWRNYAFFLIQNSPAVRDLVHSHSDWYLAYKKLITQNADLSGGRPLSTFATRKAVGRRAARRRR